MRADPHEKMQMADLIYLALTAAFFAVSIAYVNGCEKLRGGGQ